MSLFSAPLSHFAGDSDADSGIVALGPLSCSTRVGSTSSGDTDPEPAVAAPRSALAPSILQPLTSGLSDPARSGRQSAPLDKGSAAAFKRVRFDDELHLSEQNFRRSCRNHFANVYQPGTQQQQQSQHASSLASQQQVQLRDQRLPIPCVANYRHESGNQLASSLIKRPLSLAQQQFYAKQHEQHQLCDQSLVRQQQEQQSQSAATSTACCGHCAQPMPVPRSSLPHSSPFSSASTTHMPSSQSQSSSALMSASRDCHPSHLRAHPHPQLHAGNISSQAGLLQSISHSQHHLSSLDAHHHYLLRKSNPLSTSQTHIQGHASPYLFSSASQQHPAASCNMYKSQSCWTLSSGGVLPADIPVSRLTHNYSPFDAPGRQLSDSAANVNKLPTIDQDPLESTDSMVCAFASVASVVSEAMKRRSAAAAAAAAHLHHPNNAPGMQRAVTSTPQSNATSGLLKQHAREATQPGTRNKNTDSALVVKQPDANTPGVLAANNCADNEGDKSVDHLYETIYPNKSLSEEDANPNRECDADSDGAFEDKCGEGLTASSAPVEPQSSRDERDESRVEKEEKECAPEQILLLDLTQDAPQLGARFAGEEKSQIAEEDILGMNAQSRVQSRCLLDEDLQLLSSPEFQTAQELTESTPHQHPMQQQLTPQSTPISTSCEWRARLESETAIKETRKREKLTNGPKQPRVKSLIKDGKAARKRSEVTAEVEAIVHAAETKIKVSPAKTMANNAMRQQQTMTPEASGPKSKATSSPQLPPDSVYPPSQDAKQSGTTSARLGSARAPVTAISAEVEYAVVTKEHNRSAGALSAAKKVLATSDSCLSHGSGSSAMDKVLDEARSRSRGASAKAMARSGQEYVPKVPPKAMHAKSELLLTSVGDALSEEDKRCKSPPVNKGFLQRFSGFISRAFSSDRIHKDRSREDAAATELGSAPRLSTSISTPVIAARRQCSPAKSHKPSRGQEDQAQVRFEETSPRAPSPGAREPAKPTSFVKSIKTRMSLRRSPAKVKVKVDVKASQSKGERKAEKAALANHTSSSSANSPNK